MSPQATHAVSEYLQSSGDTPYFGILLAGASAGFLFVCYEK
ncbi:hypothetical protein [Kingella potus]|nr:hypothetical protein [Kingella potus]